MGHFSFLDTQTVKSKVYGMRGKIIQLYLTFQLNNKYSSTKYSPDLNFLYVGRAFENEFRDALWQIQQRNCFLRSILFAQKTCRFISVQLHVAGNTRFHSTRISNKLPNISNGLCLSTLPQRVRNTHMRGWLLLLFKERPHSLVLCIKSFWMYIYIYICIYI